MEVCERVGDLLTATKTDGHTKCMLHHKLQGHLRKHRLENKTICSNANDVSADSICIVCCDYIVALPPLQVICLDVNDIQSSIIFN